MSNEDPKIVLYEDDLYEETEAKEETRLLIVFRVSQEWYGVDIDKVREVVRAEKITYLPSTAFHIVGILNLRGNILSVTDLKRFFGLPSEKPSPKPRLVVVKYGNLETGFLADEVSGLMEVPLSKISPTLVTIRPEQAHYIEGQYKMAGKLIGILKAGKILEQHV